ncbi:MAG TPA: adenylosuccinate synthase [Candidatus Cloacimonadota bacterium]|nr:adenylosuccinate synthase [Candidatus Cloacimonadota bacterium]
MSSIAVLGCMFGDEAKAKIVDVLAKDADIVVRFQGGNNAGHTIWLDGRKYVFHMVPSGILFPKIICALGSGVVIDPFELLDEMNHLRAEGIDFTNRFYIDPRAAIVLPLHKILDKGSESAQGMVKIGTTQRGIGPAYADAVARWGIRFSDLYHPTHLSHRIRNLFHAHHISIEGDELVRLDSELSRVAEILKPFMKQIPYLLQEAEEQGKKILFEGAQGSLLDITFGTYPFVTSSHTIAGGVSIGAGFAPKHNMKVVGVYKAYVTRVGEGPFPTELHDSIGDLIREQGHEYGATTGRPRRCGWFDAFAARFTVMVNGVDEIAITLVDVLSGLGTIKICTGYQLDGEMLYEFPAETQLLEKVTPLYAEYPGWTEDITTCRNFDDLPENCRNYIHAIAKILDRKITMVSVGPDRSQTIFIQS